MKNIFSISTLKKIGIIFLVLTLLFLLINTINSGEKKVLNNNFSLTLDSFDKPYTSKAVDDFCNFVVENDISLDEINNENLKIDLDGIAVNDSYEHLFFYGNDNNALNDLKKEVNSKYGGNWDRLNNLDFNNKGNILYSSNMKEVLLPTTFDFNKDMTGFGIGTMSSSELINYIDVDYVKDDSNYAISLKDIDGDTIIYMKNNNFGSYREAFEYYLENKNDINTFMNGGDSVIFKTIEIDQLGIYEPCSNLKIKDTTIENYYLYLLTTINGLGVKENATIQVLDDTNFKYNFMENSIIFIVKNGEMSPYFAYKY